MLKLLTKHRLVSCLTGLVLLLLCGSLQAQRNPDALTGGQRVALQKQNGVTFNRLPLLPATVLGTAREAGIRSTVSAWQNFELPANFYTGVKQTGNTPVELSLPVPDGGIITLELVPVNLFGNDHVAKTSAGEILHCDGRYFQGIVKGEPSSFAAISMYNNEIAGIFSNSHGNYVVGRMQDAAAKAGSPVHIVYNDKDLLTADGFACKTPDSPVPVIPVTKDGKDEEDPAAPEATKCIRLYIETEYDVFQTFGSSSAVQQYINTIYNVTNNVYQAAGVTLAVPIYYIWTSNDPYNGGSADATLTEFANYRRASAGGFFGDAGQLITFRFGPNNTQGLAGAINGLCSGNPRERVAVCFGSSSTAGLPTYNRTAKILAHEFGHLMGSQHTHACAWNGNNTAIDGCAPVEGSCSRPGIPANGGTIMSYCDQTAAGINFALGLGAQPGQRIVNTINAAPCLAYGSCGQPCFTPQDITATYAPNNWTISWSYVPGAAYFTVETRVGNNPNWTASPAVTGNSFSFGGLDPGVTAYARVRSNCTNAGSTNYSQIVSFTGVYFCSLPSYLGASDINTTSARITWISPASTNIIEYKQQSSGTWISLGALSGSSVVLTGLTPYTLYDVRIKPVCDATPYPGYIATQFTTQDPPCNAPTGLSTYNSTLQWAAVSGAVSYTVQYKPASESTWTTVTGITTNSYNIGTYTAGTLYDWQVKTVCANNESGYTGAQFTTPGDCATISNLASTNITETSASVSWTINGNINSINTIHLEYKPASSSTWIVENTGRRNTTSYEITGLTPGTLYDWRVRAMCGNNAFITSAGAYTSAQFTTLLNCTAPTGLLGDNSGCCGDVSFIWNTVTGAQTYTLEFKRTNNSTWSVIDNIVGNGIDLNLVGGSYNWRVKANCAGGSSAYTDGSTLFVIFNPRCCDPGGMRTTTTEAAKEKPQIQTTPLRVSPQPASGQLNVYFNAMADGRLSLSLTDQFGRPVLQQNKLINAGSNQLQLDVSKLTPGVYVVKATCGSQVETIKVIVQH